MEGVQSGTFLLVGLVSAAVGLALIVYLIATMYRDVRAKARLAEQAPDTSTFDRDLSSYLDRVWLLIAAWKPRVPAGAAGELDELWAEAFTSAERLQASREHDGETADQVANLVSLESRIEDRIDELSQSA